MTPLFCQETELQRFLQKMEVLFSEIEWSQVMLQEVSVSYDSTLLQKMETPFKKAWRHIILRMFPVSRDATLLPKIEAFFISKINEAPSFEKRWSHMMLESAVRLYICEALQIYSLQWRSTCDTLLRTPLLLLDSIKSVKNTISIVFIFSWQRGVPIFYRENGCSIFEKEWSHMILENSVGLHVEKL